MLHFLEVLLVNVARAAVAGLADGGGAADGDSHHADGLHDADGAQRLAGDADVAAGHEEVRHVARVEATVGNRVADLVVDGMPVDGLRDEGPVGVGLGVNRVRDVQVDRPSGQHAAVGEGLLAVDVGVAEDHVAEQLLGFAGAADVGHPVQFRPAVALFLGVAGGVGAVVLDRVPGAEGREQVPVPGLFQLLDRMVVEAAFPEPLGMSALRVGKALVVEREHPRFLAEGLRLGLALPHPHVAHAHATLLGHRQVGAGPLADEGVAGAVGEKGAAHFLEFAGLHFQQLGGGDLLAAHLQTVTVVAEEERDVLLRGNDPGLLVIDELLGRSGRGLRLVLDLAHDVGHQELARRQVALCPNADFRRSVAAQHLTVLDQRDLAAHPRRGNGRAEAAVAAADDDQVEVPGVFNGGRRPRDLPRDAVFQQALLRWLHAFVAAEENRVHPAVEAGQVFQCDRGAAGGQRGGAGFFPVPLAVALAEFVADLLAADAHREAPRAAFPAERLRPVHGPHPDLVSAGFRDLDRGAGVRDRLAEAVGDQVGRAHGLDELSVDLPAAMGGELLGFDHQAIGGMGCRSGHRRQGDPGDKSGFHHFG